MQQDSRSTRKAKEIHAGTGEVGVSDFVLVACFAHTLTSPRRNGRKTCIEEAAGMGVAERCLQASCAATSMPADEGSQWAFSSLPSLEGTSTGPTTPHGTMGTDGGVCGGRVGNGGAAGGGTGRDGDAADCRRPSGSRTRAGALHPPLPTHATVVLALASHTSLGTVTLMDVVAPFSSV